MRSFVASLVVGVSIIGCQSGDPPREPSIDVAPPAPEVATPSTTSVEPPAPESAPSAAPIEEPRRSGVYATWQSFPLHRRTNGFDGTLRLLEDSRVTKRGASRGWDRYFLEPTLLLARLELVADDGRVVDAEELIRPIADIAVHDLRGDGKPTFFVTTDATCGMGSYCGPITELVEITGPHLGFVEEVDDKTNQFRRIELVVSMKTDWRLVPAKTGHGLDLLEVRCRPNRALFDILLGEEKPITFVTAYSRISFEKAAWVRRWKQRLEYRDVDEGAYGDRIWTEI